jgi:hypothetical protein
VETEFLESPALLTFFINRVGFKEGKLVKDLREFKFEEYLYLPKCSGAAGTGNKTSKEEGKNNIQPTQSSSSPSST